MREDATSLPYFKHSYLDQNLLDFILIRHVVVKKLAEDYYYGTRIEKSVDAVFTSSQEEFSRIFLEVA